MTEHPQPPAAARDGPDHAAVRGTRADADAHQAPRPRLSVILPLLDARGRAREAIRSWSAGQDMPRGDLELVVLSDGRDRAVLDAVSPLLAPHDQLVVAPGNTLMALYALGARRARGDILLVTEAHCEAEANAASATWAHFAAHAVDAVSLGCYSRSRKPLARMEDRLFALDVAWRKANAPWNRLFLRGCAIRREAYLAAGGLQAELGFFAEPALADALHRRGAKTGAVPEARILHHNTSTLREVYDAVRNYARGQCAVRATMPGAEFDARFGRLPEWPHYGNAATRFARAAFADGLRICIGPSSGPARRPAAAGLARLGAAAIFGRRGAIAAAFFRMSAAILRTWLWRRHDARLERAYLDTHRRMAAWLRLRWLARNAPAIPLPPLGPGRTGAADLVEERVFGFHLPEIFAGAPFRWMQPRALIPLALAPGRYRVVLETRGVRPGLRAGDVAAAFNGRLVAAAALAIGDTAVTIELDVAERDAGPQRLLLLATRLGPPPGSTDTRALGLPVFALAIEPVARAAGPRGATLRPADATMAA